MLHDCMENVDNMKVQRGKLIVGISTFYEKKSLIKMLGMKNIIEDMKNSFNGQSTRPRKRINELNKKSVEIIQHET